MGRSSYFAYRFFRNNFVLLALMLLVVWLVIVWNVLRGSEQFGAYAAFGTAAATVLLALGTALMVRESMASRKLTEELVRQNRQLRERPHALDLLVSVVIPILQCAEQIINMHNTKEYRWHYYASKPEIIKEEELPIFQPFTDVDNSYCPEPDLKLSWCEGGIFQDFRTMFPQLVDEVMVYNNLQRQGEFKDLLVSLAREILLSPQFAEVDDSLRVFCAHLAFSSLLMSEKNFSDSLLRIVAPGDAGMRLEEAKELWKKNGIILADSLRNNEQIAIKLEQISEHSTAMMIELDEIQRELSKVKEKLMTQHDIYYSEIEKKLSNSEQS